MYLIDVQGLIPAVAALREPLLVGKTVPGNVPDHRAGAGAHLHSVAVGVAVVDEAALPVEYPVFVAHTLLSFGAGQLEKSAVCHTLHGDRLPIREVADKGNSRSVGSVCAEDRGISGDMSA